MQLMLSKPSKLITRSYMHKKRKAIHFSGSILLSYSHQQPLLEKRKGMQLYIELPIYTSILNLYICPTQQTKPGWKALKPFSLN